MPNLPICFRCALTLDRLGALSRVSDVPEVLQPSEVHPDPVVIYDDRIGGGLVERFGQPHAADGRLCVERVDDEFLDRFHRRRIQLLRQQRHKLPRQTNVYRRSLVASCLQARTYEIHGHTALEIRRTSRNASGKLGPTRVLDQRGRRPAPMFAGGSAGREGSSPDVFLAADPVPLRSSPPGLPRSQRGQTAARSDRARSVGALR